MTENILESHHFFLNTLFDIVEIPFVLSSLTFLPFSEITTVSVHPSHPCCGILFLCTIHTSLYCKVITVYMLLQFAFGTQLCFQNVSIHVNT